MPGEDRTGPFGKGRGTGRGLGPCGRKKAAIQQPKPQDQDLGQSQQSQPGQGFFARLGQGLGRRMGRGFGRMGQGRGRNA